MKKDIRDKHLKPERGFPDFKSEVTLQTTRQHYPEVDAVGKPIQVVLKHSVASHCTRSLVTFLNMRVLCDASKIEKIRSILHICLEITLQETNLASFFKLALHNWSDDIEREDNRELVRNHTCGSWEQSTGC